jgi:site-specific DNA recombinase
MTPRIVAAIYCRKSTEERGKTDENKSVRRQEQYARAFAAKQGWTVGPVFVDDGISGAEFERRPGLQSMLREAKARAFSVVVVSEQKSIGREQRGTANVIHELKESGVTVYLYSDGRCLTPRKALDKGMLAFSGIGRRATARSYGCARARVA